jgi:hypothetical protein
MAQTDSTGTWWRCIGEAGLLGAFDFASLYTRKNNIAKKKLLEFLVENQTDKRLERLRQTFQGNKIVKNKQ